MSPRKIPPGPKEHFLFGNALDYMRDPLGFCLHCARQHGDVVRNHVPGMTTYQLNHPDLIQSVLVKNHHLFIKDRFTRDLANVLGSGLLVSEGGFWRRQRQLAQPAFHRRQVESYGDVMVRCTERLLQTWQDGETRDVHADLMGLTMQIVTKTLFDAEVKEAASEVGAAIEVVMKDAMGLRGLLRALSPRLLKALDRLPTPGTLRARWAVQRLDEILYPVIRERRSSGRDRGDLLSMLLHAQDEDGTRMTDRQLRDEVVTLFLAGHETTALALSYTMLLLSQHPEQEQRLVHELEEVLGGRTATIEDLPRLRTTEWVVKESMRLYPPAWAIGREALEDCEIGGYSVPAGTQLLMVQWVMHRDPRYFDEPEAFRPERWDHDLARRLPRFAYFPFGGGPRACIGNSFAMLEAVLLLATIVQRYRLRLMPGYRLELLPSVTLRPSRGIPMVLSRRARSGIRVAALREGRQE